ncbi:MAG: DUF2064 domain-containing protein [Gammaproteobacteria bacterium PRO9]|nr:DUF2064 domain-containing protein [Gammaproteobacteria bacterium PRO9]
MRLVDEPTLVLVCRRPSPGVGKRRLARDLGEDATFMLCELMLAAALEDLAAWPGRTVVAPAAAPDATWARSLHDGRCSVVPQPAGNLGTRLGAIDRQLRAQGHAALLYFGSDAPALLPADYVAARQALSRSTVVLGPALDGGVTCRTGLRSRNFRGAPGTCTRHCNRNVSGPASRWKISRHVMTSMSSRTCPAWPRICAPTTALRDVRCTGRWRVWDTAPDEPCRQHRRPADAPDRGATGIGSHRQRGHSRRG